MTKTRITVARIDSELATFTTNRDSLLHLAHNIAMMIVYHAAPKELSDDCNGTGDCTRALALMEALPKSWAVQYSVWLNAFTPIRVNLSGGNVGYDAKYRKLSAEEKLAWWNIAGANENPFNTFSREPDVKFFDAKAMKTFIDRLPNQIEGKFEKGLVPDGEDAMIATLLKAELERIDFRALQRKAQDMLKKAQQDNGDNDAKAEAA